MSETRKLVAILVANVVGYSQARRCRRGAHAITSPRLGGGGCGRGLGCLAGLTLR
jgi:hypothetical protein